MIAYRPDGSCGCADRVPSVFRNPHIESANGYAVGESYIGRKHAIRHQVSRSLARSQCGFVKGHPFEHSRSKLRVANLRDRVSKPAILQPDVVALVYGLDFYRRPSTVAWLVVPVIVDSVDRQIVSVSVRYRPVSEGFVTTGPRRTHRDAAPAIVRPVSVSGVAASIEHAAPYLKKASTAFAMSLHALSSYISVVAAARFDSTITQLLAYSNNFIPAFTSAPPPSATVFIVGCSVNHCEPSEGLPTNIKECCK